MAKRFLTRSTRKAFIKAAAKEGVLFKPVKGVAWSTTELARYSVAEKWTPKGFRIGAGYKALVG